MDKLRKENEKLRTDLQATKEEVEKLSKLVTYKSQDLAPHRVHFHLGKVNLLTL